MATHNTTTVERKKTMKKAGAKQMIQKSVKPFLVGGIATAAASHFIKGNKGAKMQKKMEEAQQHAMDLAKDSPITEMVKNTMGSEEKTKENPKEKTNKQEQQPNNGMEKESHNDIVQSGTQNNLQGDNNPAKQVETGGF